MKYSVIAALILTVIGCDLTMPPAPLENELLDGPLDGLTADQQRQFLAGDIAFGDDVFTSSTGLGPIFVANRCASCHAGDGKGHPFITFTRFGQPDTLGNRFLDQGGPQLQHKALPGFEPEQLPAGASSSDLLAPAVTGLGFLDAVTDADIIAMADPNDLDGDGISGRPNWVYPPSYVNLRPNAIEKSGKYIARFGKKSAAYDLLHQTSAAYNQDMGITSTFEPQDVYSGLNIDPEVSDKTVHDVVFYLKTLKAPLRRDIDNPDVIVGESIFEQIDCAKCHMPELKSGESPISVIANKTFYPYTDMLIHDMGSALDDGYTEGYALTSEWKTPALWGIGLSKESQGGAYFLLHDGRAESIEEAILLHGGEADASRSKYNQLTQTEKDQLITFLNSL